MIKTNLAPEQQPQSEPQLAPEPPFQPQPTWTTSAGTFKGWYDQDLARATGIRYARASRYGKPFAEPPTEQVIQATSWSPSCPQPRADWVVDIFNKPDRHLNFSEDCQYLSITLPANIQPGEAVPVMVWIHGGSYTSGAGDLDMFDPAPLVREQRVMVVSVTYRLGLLGFLGDGVNIPANLGLFDQIEALKWVNRHIADFGGDPTNITLFGQSAGGDAIAHLMIASGTEGLFQRAIIQSAPFGIGRGRAAMTMKMLNEAARIEHDATIEDLLEAHTHVHKSAERFGLMSGMPFGVQYGHDPLPAEDKIDEAWLKVASSVEVLVGCTDREVAMFVPSTPVLGKIKAVPFIGKVITHSAVKAVTKRIYGAGVLEFAKRHRQGGGRGYRYQLVWGAPNNVYAGSHCSDLPLLFGDQSIWENAPLVTGAAWSDIEQAGKQLRAVWGGFAWTGKIHSNEIPGVIHITDI